MNRKARYLAWLGRSPDRGPWCLDRLCRTDVDRHALARRCGCGRDRGAGVGSALPCQVHPTLLGEADLLAEGAFAIPTVPTALALLLFLWPASVRIRSEGAALRTGLGTDYDFHASSVPRRFGLPKPMPTGGRV